MSVEHRVSLPNSIYASSDDVLHNGEAWSQSPGIDPWQPMILTLDGGGIRGYSSLIILRALMHEVAVWERRLDKENPPSGSPRDSKVGMDGVSQVRRSQGPDRLSPARSSPLRRSGDSHDATGADFDEDKLLPCHYFDFMYGTSTGGLIATMLGRLRMSVPQCLDVYRTVGQDLFGKRRSYLPLATKYHHQPLEFAVRKIVQENCKQHLPKAGCDGEDWYPWELEIDNPDIDLDRHICQVICLTAVNNGKIDEAHLLRTYNHVYRNIPNWITPYNEGPGELRIWQATRATSAAPFYFKSLELEIHGQIWQFKDGGIRENNPAGAAWSEFISLYGERQTPALLLSVGTGRPDESNDGFAVAWPGPFAKSKVLKAMSDRIAVFKNVLVKYTEGEKTHKDMLRLAQGQSSWYKRLNVDSGMKGLPLDEWRKGPWTNPADNVTRTVNGGATLTRMEEATREYLMRDLDMAFDTYAPPKVMISQTAEKLVRQRRARHAASNVPNSFSAKHWDTFMGKYISGEFTGKADVPVAQPMQTEKA